MPWYVVITKPKAERKVAQRLEALGITVCCLCRVERRQWSDRVKKVEVPLLPSMVLVQLLDKDRNMVFDVPGVLRYLFYLGEPAKVRDEEVEVLKSMLNTSNQRLVAKAIQPGDTIEVPGLGSQAQKGVVKQVSANRCWVVLEQLGLVVSVQRETVTMA